MVHLGQRRHGPLGRLCGTGPTIWQGCSGISPSRMAWLRIVRRNRPGLRLRGRPSCAPGSGARRGPRRGQPLRGLSPSSGSRCRFSRALVQIGRARRACAAIATEPRIAAGMLPTDGAFHVSREVDSLGGQPGVGLVVPGEGDGQRSPDRSPVRHKACLEVPAGQLPLMAELASHLDPSRPQAAGRTISRATNVQPKTYHSSRRNGHCGALRGRMKKDL